MRRTVRLVIALCALAAFTAPAAMAAERMWVGFHDDPELPLGPGPCGPYTVCVARGRDDHAPARAVEPRCAAAAFQPRGSVRPGVRLRRRRRGASRPRRRRTWRSCSRSPGRRGGRTATRTRTSCRGGSRTSPRSRGRSRPGTRAASTATPSCASGGLERAQPAAFPYAAVQCGRQVGRTCELREALRGGLHRHQGRQPAREDRDRRDVCAR